jgi:hydroxyacylglutathione hydrolase
VRIEQILCGGDRNFGYLIVHQNEACLVDPGEDPSLLLERLRASGSKLRWLIGTHAHADHIASMQALQEETGAQIVLSEFASGTTDLAKTLTQTVLRGERSRLELGDLELELLATPGHTPCSLCVLTPEVAGHRHLLTGDTLFVGKVGGTTDRMSALSEFRSLGRLLELDDTVLVWPGHHYGVRPTSSIGEERRENPFLRRKDFEDFCWLKDNWADYKAEHCIA